MSSDDSVRSGKPEQHWIDVALQNCVELETYFEIAHQLLRVSMIILDCDLYEDISGRRDRRSTSAILQNKAEVLRNENENIYICKSS